MVVRLHTLGQEQWIARPIQGVKLRMPVFVSSAVIEASIETVFAFHEREDALQLLSPPFPPMRVLSRTGGIEVGACVELQIGPVRWLALHTAFEKNRYFEDRQVSGPFAKWTHRHEFDSVSSGTRLTDRVEFHLPGGTVIDFLLGWAVKLGLRQMFRERHRRTKLFCEQAQR